VTHLALGVIDRLARRGVSRKSGGGREREKHQRHCDTFHFYLSFPVSRLAGTRVWRWRAQSHIHGIISITYHFFGAKLWSLMNLI
jgi:hypothetical protein